MTIKQIFQNKTNYLYLLLLADEQESMINRYLERGDMFALYDKDVLCSVSIVTDEGQHTCELKNIATYPAYQRRGYGRQLINYLLKHYQNKYQTMIVGTGNSPITISFYEKCGFIYSHRIPNFFTDNYDHPIFENGQQLIDMIYLKINLTTPKLHYFGKSIKNIPLPEKFTYPFHYTPHPLCIIAAKEVQEYLREQRKWEKELEEGKMFGVLVVQTNDNKIGYLAAFSGILAGENNHSYFVPPIYDLLQPDDFFKKEETKISEINKQIFQIENNKDYLAIKNWLVKKMADNERKLNILKEHLRTCKEIRNIKRKQNPSKEELEAIIRESQYQKAEFKRVKQNLQNSILPQQTLIEKTNQIIEELKKERKSRSANLQLKLFKQFQILNGKGIKLDLCEIFRETTQKIPPAGAGECAAPKLLQYAYLNQLKPIAMAEFWWGNSPKTEIRRHGYFYPACKNKCEPILKHMLKGLEVEDNPLLENIHHDTKLEILYEDEWLIIVNKPAGMLSVPGKLEIESVFGILHKLYPDATGPMIVHRLDMATSGIMLVAKTKTVHQNLQTQFENRTIKKRYAALLEGNIHSDNGIIDLPVCANPNDRPRQTVNTEYGKPAITRYEVIKHIGNRTLISFYPITGRTHQLRVHAAHHLGLNAPIVGDELYGEKAERLYLHAEYLEFKHPVTGENISIEKKADFF